ncbi:interleukin-10 isoform 1-T1 [Spinachia spinachia]
MRPSICTSLLGSSGRPRQENIALRKRKERENLHLRPVEPAASSVPGGPVCASTAASMTPRSLLLCALVLCCLLASSRCTPVCNNRCCRFVEGFPVRLRKLRQDYSRIRDFFVSKSTTLTRKVPREFAQHHLRWVSVSGRCCRFSRPHMCLLCLSLCCCCCPRSFVCGQEANDDLDTALLDQSVEDSFKSPFACHTVDGILDFYLTSVLPTAMAGVTEDTRDLQPHMESIKQIFDGLKRDVFTCRKYFSCIKPFDINNLNSTYSQMESKGPYKAMGEIDLLLNYIETYLASQRHRNPV